MDAAVELTHGAFDFRMPLVADHDELVAFFRELGDLDMHLGDQRAGGIEYLKTTRRSFLLHRLADAVRAKDQCCPRRHIRQRLNKNCAFGFQFVDDIGVVHDLVAHVNRRAEFGQGALDNFNRTVHASAKAARLCKHDFVWTGIHVHRIPIS